MSIMEVHTLLLRVYEKSLCYIQIANFPLGRTLVFSCVFPVKHIVQAGRQLRCTVSSTELFSNDCDDEIRNFQLAIGPKILLVRENLSVFSFALPVDSQNWPSHRGLDYIHPVVMNKAGNR